MKAIVSLPLFAAVVALAGPALAQEKPGQLVKEKEIPLEGAGGFDYVTVDSAAQRLYVAHGAKIDVLDIAKGERVGQVDGVDGSHGTAIVTIPANAEKKTAETKLGFSTAGRKNKVIVFDTATLKAVKEIETGQGCDGILYVTAANEVWSFNGRDKNITCIDPVALTVKATIPLEGRPEAAVEDAAKNLVYLDLEDKSAIAVIDQKAHKVTSTHAIEGAEEPSGLAFDAKHGLVFAGCGNQKMALLDTTSWKTVGTPEIGEHCDGCAFDPEFANAFASCRTGTFVVHVKDGTTFEALPSLEGGKTCTLDAKTHRLFVVSGPKRGEQGTVKVTVFALPKL
jgi:DNA-binding beta-propeller fold protein YncE